MSVIDLRCLSAFLPKIVALLVGSFKLIDDDPYFTVVKRKTSLSVHYHHSIMTENPYDLLNIWYFNIKPI